MDKWRTWGTVNAMKLPAPQDTLANCVWLPRLLAKARQLKDGSLPPDYAARFCHPTGVDAQFLAFFQLTPEAVQAAAARLESVSVPSSRSRPAFRSLVTRAGDIGTGKNSSDKKGEH